MAFAPWLQLPVCGRHAYSACPGSPTVSSPSGQSASCVSLLWGIFWTSECLSPQVGQDRSVATLNQWGALLMEKYPSFFHRQWKVLRRALHAFSAVFLGLSPSFPSSDPFLNVPLLAFLPFQTLLLASSQCFLGSPSQKTICTQILDSGSDFEGIQTKSIKLINLIFSCFVTLSNLLPSLTVSICLFIK